MNEPFTGQGEPKISIGDWRARLEQDLLSMGLDSNWKYSYFFTNRIAWFMLVLRLAEAMRESANLLGRPFYLIVRFYFDLLSERMGFDIPLGVFAPGLSIAHRGTIVVNGNTKVGRNCRIHPGVTLGAAHGESPEIGDNVFIGPGVGVFGGITVGDGSVLAPHSLITKSLEAGSLALGNLADVRRAGRPWSDPSSDLGPTVKHLGFQQK